MNKVFLYLYPIQEYFKMFLFTDDKYYEEWNVPRPLPILNDLITKRYREQGYQVVIAIYPDKEIFGITPHPEDKILHTDVLFTEASGYRSDGSEKPLEEVKYPSEEHLISSLGEVDELRVGGFHFSDCVKRVAEHAINKGINTLVDLDLTDLFFNVYRREGYLNYKEYIPEDFKEMMIKRYSSSPEEEEYERRLIEKNYASPVYGMNKEEAINKTM